MKKVIVLLSENSIEYFFLLINSNPGDSIFVRQIFYFKPISFSLFVLLFFNKIILFL